MFSRGYERLIQDNESAAEIIVNGVDGGIDAVCDDGVFAAGRKGRGLNHIEGHLKRRFHLGEIGFQTTFSVWLLVLTVYSNTL